MENLDLKQLDIDKSLAFFIELLPEKSATTLSFIINLLIIIASILLFILNLVAKSRANIVLVHGSKLNKLDEFLSLISKVLRKLKEAIPEQAPKVNDLYVDEKTIDNSNFPYQINTELKEEIRNYGCYMISILKAFADERINNPSDLNKEYDRLLRLNLIDKNCLVLDAQKLVDNIINENIKQNKGYIGKIKYTYQNKDSVFDFPNFIVIAKYINGQYEHFLQVIKDNSRGGYKVYFDPIPDSRTYREGRINSLRVFEKIS